MPSKHCKNAGDRSFFSHSEKKRANQTHGSIHQRLGTESQLPFGYCPLSIAPIEDACASPSGHLYSREAILEYLLNKMKDLKTKQHLWEQQQLAKDTMKSQIENKQGMLMISNFVSNELNLKEIIGRNNISSDENEFHRSRKRLIDETDSSTLVKSLAQSCPWVVTPSAEASEHKAPPKRPLSPFSGRPLRVKDLIPVNLLREDSVQSAGPVRFIDPISRKTITTQKVVLIKSTGTVLLESTAQEVVYKSMRDPITNKLIAADDIMELVNAGSGFAASGDVESKRYRPSLN